MHILVLVKLAQIKEWKEARPFRPFMLLTADGREYRVPHEDFIWLPAPDSVFVVTPRGTAALLDPVLVTGIEALPPDTAK